MLLMLPAAFGVAEGKHRELALARTWWNCLKLNCRALPTLQPTGGAKVQTQKRRKEIFLLLFPPFQVCTFAPPIFCNVPGCLKGLEESKS